MKLNLQLMYNGGMLNYSGLHKPVFAIQCFGYQINQNILVESYNENQ